MSARLKLYAFRLLLVCTLHGISKATSWGSSPKEVVREVKYSPNEIDQMNLASLAWSYVYKDKLPTDMTYQGKTVKNILTKEPYELPSEIYETKKSGFKHMAKHAGKHMKKGYTHLRKFFGNGKLSDLGKAVKNKASGLWKGLVAMKSSIFGSNLEDHQPPVLAIKWEDICVVSYRGSMGADWTKTNLHGVMTAAHEDLERFDENELLMKFKELKRPSSPKPFWYAINHGYFYHFLKSYERVKKSLKRAGCTPENTVATGHSLGGSVAVVLALSGQANYVVGVGAPKVVKDESFRDTHRERLKDIHVTELAVKGDPVVKIGGKGIMPFLPESNKKIARLAYPEGAAEKRAKRAITNFNFYVPLKVHAKTLYNWLLYDTKVLKDEIYLQLCVHTYVKGGPLELQPRQEYCEALEERMDKN